MDTIKLTLDKSMFWISDSSKFEKNMMNASRGYYTLVQNPTKGELKSGMYKPRLTISHRYNCSGRSEETLAIELSLPKLLFGNNFDELTLDDYEKVADKMGIILKQMGVMIFRNILDRAPVSMVHYSKNIPLTDGSTPHYLISKIKEANIQLFLDVNQTDYRNDGHSYKWHSNSYEVAFYDKIKDLEITKKSTKRAIEKDGRLQLDLFENFKDRNKFEVLRMEVRLNQRQKIGQIFRLQGINTEITFKNLFSPEISQKVLFYYLDEIEKRRLPLLDYKTSNPKALMTDIIMQNPSLGPTKVIQLFGLKQAFDSMNPRELRLMLGRGKDRSWYRLIAQAKAIKLPITKSPLSIVRDNLVKFEPLRLVDYQDKMLNNDKYQSYERN